MKMVDLNIFNQIARIMKKLLYIFVPLLFSQFSSASPNTIMCKQNLCKSDECYEKDLTFHDDDLTSSNESIIQISAHNAKYYENLTPENNFVDITNQILQDQNVPDRMKANIQKYNKKLLVFVYPSDDFQVPGFVTYTPSSKSDLVVYLRGGNSNFGIINPAFLAAYGNKTVLGTLYRGSVGPGKDEFGGAEVNDINNLVKFIPKIERHLKENFRAKHKYLVGESRGGMELFRAITKFTNLQKFFDKAISVSGAVDLESWSGERSRIHTMFQEKFGLTEQNKDSWFRLRSAKYSIDKIRKDFPILILQGTNDQRTGLTGGVELFRMMQKSGHNITYWEIKDANHCLVNCRDKLNIINEWLAR